MTTLAPAPNPAPSPHLGDLEPSHLRERTYRTRRGAGRIGAALVLSVMLALLTLIPSRLILPGLDEAIDAGRPAILLCIAMWCWWILARFNPRLLLVGPQPIRWGVLLFLLSMFVSYAVGFMRGLTEMEANSADRWILSIAAFVGVVLMTADGLPNWDQLNRVLRVLVWCCAFMALVGFLQYAIRVDLTQYLEVPGLRSLWSGPDLQPRGGEVRAASTATHYIELSAVLAMALPFAVHYARFAKTSPQRQRFVLLALITMSGVLATVSRTGIVAVAIAALVMFPTWSWRLRYNMLVVGTAVLAALAAVRPSLASTLLSLFSGASEDPSITSRTERYDMVGYYFSQTPWLGRGTGTWVPPQYQFLDNQWLETALMNGIVGVAAVAMLHIIAISLAVLAMRRAESAEVRHLCAALVAAQLIGIFVGFTFDSLWYSTYTTVLGLLTGVCGAVWRFTHPRRAVRTSAVRPGREA